MPSPVAAPKLLGWSDDLAAELQIQRPGTDSDWLAALAGNQLIEGMQPYASCYGGHQFGNWAGQLGDGRAISLGEMPGKSDASWELQLKGAGPTPYSRTADGRAVLRSSLREFLCSEAMHYLGVPTTRALSLVATGDSVERDMFYDGNPESEPGAIVCRVAPSFIRLGNFQLPAARGDTALLKQLADFTIRHHFPQIKEGDYVGWFAEVCRTTAKLIVDWMAVGFVHGVMNTDNLSIHGLTIDYGPYGWLEPFDQSWTPNTTDAEMRRYCFGNQSAIGQWNLAQFGGALISLVGDAAPLEEALKEYAQSWGEYWHQRFSDKLGLFHLDQAALTEQLNALWALMQENETDYCLLFRRLSRLSLDIETSDEELMAPLHDAFYVEPDAQLRQRWCQWLRSYIALTNEAGIPAGERIKKMNSANPKYVLRNYLAQQAIDAASQGDVAELETLQEILKNPYDEQPEYEQYSQRRPEWARNKAGCSALSCSS